MEWVKSREGKLKGMSSITEESRESIPAELIDFLPRENMYDMCIKKIYKVDEQISTKGPMYTSFEEAISYFREHGKIDENTDEIKEFNDLIGLLYLGRKG